MGGGCICKKCGYEKSEDFIINNLYNGEIILNMDYNLLLKYFKHNRILIGNNSNINFERYKDIISSFIPREFVIKDDNNGSEMFNFTTNILFEIYNFTDDKNKNNLHLLMLILYPLTSRSIKNTYKKIMEFFKLLKLVTLTNKDGTREHIYEKDIKDHIQNVEIWKTDSNKILFKTFDQNFSFYISSIIVGFSLAIKTYFENYSHALLDDMKNNFKKYYTAMYLKKFFKIITQNFYSDMFIEAKKFDLDLENFYLDFDCFMSYIKQNMFIIDFKELRQKFFKFIEEEIIAHEKNK